MNESFILKQHYENTYIFYLWNAVSNMWIFRFIVTLKLKLIFPLKKKKRPTALWGVFGQY